MRLSSCLRLALDIACGVIAGHKRRRLTERVWEIVALGLFVFSRGVCVCKGVSFMHVCSEQTVCFGVPVKWTLSGLCGSLARSSITGNPARPRPNEEGVVLGLQWEKVGTDK